MKQPQELTFAGKGVSLSASNCSLEKIQQEFGIMAKPSTVLIKMVSTADTGFFYVKKKNPRKATEKLELKKYDPMVRKHVVFKESKIK